MGAWGPDILENDAALDWLKETSSSRSVSALIRRSRGASSTSTRISAVPQSPQQCWLRTRAEHRERNSPTVESWGTS